MKAISLWQPWASLVMLGAKKVETRSWRPPEALIGQRIAIHAAKRSEDCVLDEPFSTYIPDPRLAPTGVLLGSVVLEGVFHIDHPADGRLIAHQYHRLGERRDGPVFDEEATKHELAFGNFTLGRWAWGLTEVRRLGAPIPYTGGQRFFEVNVEALMAHG